MARTVTTEDTGKLRYKKVGRGMWHHAGRIIKEGQVVMLHPSEIPVAFRGIVVCLDSEKEAEVIEETKGEDIFEIVPATAQGWFNVVNKSTGKKINEATLRLKKAEALKASMES